MMRSLNLRVQRTAAKIFTVLVVGLLATRALANPIFAGADPDAVTVGNQWWIFPTGGDASFETYMSYDLVHWVSRGTALSFSNVAWINNDAQSWHGAWAPSMLQYRGRFYLYYSVGPQTNTSPSRIGVAVGTRPQGPYVDSGRPLINDGGNGFEAIDPMAFTDPKSDITYLYAGGSAGATLRVWQLNRDLVSLKREIQTPTPTNFTEGVFVHRRKGLYYLSYSHGAWNDSTYSVHYATGPSALGPWTYQGAILQSDDHHKGPGHHSFVMNRSTGDWFIAYHRWETTQANGPYSGDRQIAIEKVVYRHDGTIVPIVMTDTPPPISKMR